MVLSSFKSVHNVPAETLKSMEESFEDWPGEVAITLHEFTAP